MYLKCRQTCCLRLNILIVTEVLFLKTTLTSYNLPSGVDIGMQFRQNLLISISLQRWDLDYDVGEQSWEK